VGPAGEWRMIAPLTNLTMSLLLVQANWLSALVVVVGSLLLFAVCWSKLEAVVKPLSDTLVDKLKYVSMPDHSAKIGYQHEVSRVQAQGTGYLFSCVRGSEPLSSVLA
jgi:hypothetical protein